MIVGGVLLCIEKIYDEVEYFYEPSHSLKHFYV